MPLMERAYIVSPEAIMQNFEGFANGSGTYSVWYSERNKYFEAPRNSNFEERVEFLQTFLENMERQRDCSLYYLRIHEDTPKGAIDYKTPYTVSLPIRAVDLNAQQKAMGMFAGVPVFPGDNYTARLDEQDKKINQVLELLQGDGEDLEPKKPEGYLGVISGLMENEQVMSVVGTALGKIADRFLSSIMPPQAAVTHLNGIADQGSVENAIQDPNIDLELLDKTLLRLAKHFDLNKDLPAMADYLDKNVGSAVMVKSIIYS